MTDLKRGVLGDPEISKMSLEKNRLASFKNWPFQDDGRTDICTAEKVTTAGVGILAKRISL